MSDKEKIEELENKIQRLKWAIQDLCDAIGCGADPAIIKNTLRDL